MNDYEKGASDFAEYLNNTAIGYVVDIWEIYKEWKEENDKASRGLLHKS